MKLITLDENIPRLLKLPTETPIRHVTSLGESLTDSDIWNYALEKDAVIITKDSDFSHRILSSEPPPKIVHLCFGNMKFIPFKEWLESVWPRVAVILENSKLVNVDPDRIASLESE